MRFLIFAGYADFVLSAMPHRFPFLLNSFKTSLCSFLSSCKTFNCFPWSTNAVRFSVLFEVSVAIFPCNNILCFLYGGYLGFAVLPVASQVSNTLNRIIKTGSRKNKIQVIIITAVFIGKYKALCIISFKRIQLMLHVVYFKLVEINRIIKPAQIFIYIIDKLHYVLQFSFAPMPVGSKIFSCLILSGQAFC